ncbi:MAG: putative amidohydrolase, partial [Cognaticolwellia sp.]
RGVRFYGRSAILGPQGRVLGVLPATGDAVLYAETQTGKTELR